MARPRRHPVADEIEAIFEQFRVLIHRMKRIPALQSEVTSGEALMEQLAVKATEARNG